MMLPPGLDHHLSTAKSNQAATDWVAEVKRFEVTPSASPALRRAFGTASELILK
jgi:hypothetical protein